MRHPPRDSTPRRSSVRSRPISPLRPAQRSTQSHRAQHSLAVVDTGSTTLYRPSAAHGSCRGAGKPWGIYTIPTYNLIVSGTDVSGRRVQYDFEVLRFGIQFKKGFSSPRVVGLADSQTHVIKDWLPHYTVHSAASVERGAWQVTGNFLIHDGPDDPTSEVYASIGCIEICHGPRGFDRFNNLLITLSGPKSHSRAERLKEIGHARNMSITYLRATRPPLSTPTPW